jgi:hypothetical protein
MKLLQRTRMKQGQRGARRGETGLFHPALASAFPQWGLCNGDCAHVRRGGRGEAAQRSVEVLGRRTYKRSRRSPRAAGESEQSELRLNRVPRSRSASFERASQAARTSVAALRAHKISTNRSSLSFASTHRYNRRLAARSLPGIKRTAFQSRRIGRSLGGAAAKLATTPHRTVRRLPVRTANPPDWGRR